MPRFFMFNPLPSQRYGPRQTIAVNGDPTAYTVNNATPPSYIPFSTSGELVAAEPSGNQFGPHNTLLVENDVGWNYDAFDLPDTGGNLVGYFFRRSVALIDSTGRHLTTFSGSQAPAGNGESMPSAIMPAAMRSETAGPGSVFTFNLCAEASTLMANGAEVGTVGGWSSAPPLYTPGAIRLDRSLEKHEGTIFDGTNRIAVGRADGVAGFDLPIDGRVYPIIQDLFLYLLSDAWCLCDQFGTMSLSGPLGDAAGKAGRMKPSVNS